MADLTGQAPPIDLIIDTDPGVDDVVALLLALAAPERLHVRAITCVAGNVRLEKTSRNALLACEWAGRRDVPVYAGAPVPLVRPPVYAADVHGVEGLPADVVHAPALALSGTDAVRYLIDTLLAVPEHSVTLAMLGPQTNLALALIQAPDIVRGIKEVVVMAGAHFNGGNVTPVAEFNVFADPHAADIVLRSQVKLTYVPLDLTHKILATPAHMAALDAMASRAGQRAARVLREYVAFDMQHYDLPGGPVHDACVIAWLMAPHLFSGRQVNVLVDSREGPTFGQTVADWYAVSGRPANALWLTDGHPEAFFKLLTDSLGRLS